MKGHSLAVEDREKLTAQGGDIVAVVDIARRTATDLASNEPVHMMITDPVGEQYPFMYHLDARHLEAEAVADGIDAPMYRIRAKLHCVTDAARAATHYPPKGVQDTRSCSGPLHADPGRARSESG